MQKIKIMTDSASDVNIENIEKYDIKVLGFSVSIDDKEFTEGIDLTLEQFYEMVKNSSDIPHTSQIRLDEFFDAYTEVYNAGYTDLIYVSISSTGSSTFQNANRAKDEFFKNNPQAKDKFNIHIIDSLNYTGAYGYPVIQSAIKVKSGASIDEILDYLTEWFECVEIYFAPYSLKYAKKSGRISATVAFAGEVLGLKPIINMVDGGSKITEKVRGEKNIIPKLLDIAEKNMIPKTPYSIIYGSEISHCDAITKEMTKKFGYAPEHKFRIGATITCHAGPDVVGVIIRSERRK